MVLQGVSRCQGELPSFCCTLEAALTILNIYSIPLPSLLVASSASSSTRSSARTPRPSSFPPKSRASIKMVSALLPFLDSNHSFSNSFPQSPPRPMATTSTRTSTARLRKSRRSRFGLARALSLNYLPLTRTFLLFAADEQSDKRIAMATVSRTRRVAPSSATTALRRPRKPSSGASSLATSASSTGTSTASTRP